MRIEAGDEAWRVDVEAAGDDLRGGTDALPGERGSGPVVAAGDTTIGLANGTGEEKGLSSSPSMVRAPRFFYIPWYSLPQFPRRMATLRLL